MESRPFRRLHLLTVLATCAAISAGCGSSSSFSPTAPTPAPPSPPHVSPNAIPIGLGETVHRVVTTSDAPYDARWGPEPCLRFAVTVPTPGILKAHLTSPDRAGLTLWVNEKAFWGANNDITGTSQVQAGTTYELVVSMHEPQSPNQAFELTTFLDPR